MLELSENAIVLPLLYGQDREFKDSFALTSTSFKDLPFLYRIRGGFLNILLSKGWFCITCH